MDEWKCEYDAPKGAVWVCGACGKYAKNKVDVGDESCFGNAVLCDETSLKMRDEGGTVESAAVFGNDRVIRGWVEGCEGRYA